MIANNQAGKQSSQARRLLLLAALGLTAGCQTSGVFASREKALVVPSVGRATEQLASENLDRELLNGPPTADQASANNKTPEPSSSTSPATAPISQVVFDEVIVDPSADSQLRKTAETSLSRLMALESPTADQSFTSTAVSSIAETAVWADGSGSTIHSINELGAVEGTVTGTITGMTLGQIEALALGNNPTIQELVATTQKAAGFRTQVSLRANPVLGYSGAQFADRETDQHTVFISQTIITADKLKLNRRVQNEALRAQLLELEAQKYRIATDIGIKFYDALAAQRRVLLIQEFQSVSDKGLEFAELRKQAEEGSQLEVVQAKVLKNEIDLALQQAEIRYKAAWRELAAIAGVPHMEPAPLAGELPTIASPLDWQSVASTIVCSSPEYQAAQTRVTQAKANICRQEVQPIPNLDLQFASGYDNGTDSGMINVQVGAPIPVFNKNQGNISAARAEYIRASREVDRIEDSIKARLAIVSGDFDSSLAAVSKYAKDILPNSREGLELAQIAYKAGETSYVQVLVAQRSFFNTNLDYIAAQAKLAQARTRVDGYVLTGALDAVVDRSGDDSLRGLTLSQQ
ncbi:Outer membrane protein TolC [Neorhodopirellula lusitana]|uniref:Outer membrane protein TolC n=1 Tax=Neorhodopirellula lusitana TaxID=445327 RepID=A0ABY1PRT8_9BACT|nr:TolC family protein [Neorhodopirellula lusitana]SMP43835.1 Outer membrane protein TolC [Neorhodopirellula lusitana]